MMKTLFEAHKATQDAWGEEVEVMEGLMGDVLSPCRCARCKFTAPNMTALATMVASHRFAVFCALCAMGSLTDAVVVDIAHMEVVNLNADEFLALVKKRTAQALQASPLFTTP